MWKYYPTLLATPVPRYTSYPTAAEFSDEVGPEEFTEAVATATGDISLYVHIPFCDRICWYCGCNTAAANRAQRLASYLDALHHEIALVADMLPAGARVRRIAFGGGSPNAISAVDFVRLMDQLTLRFPLENPLVSIELDPRSMSAEWEEVLEAIGASHASLGVQTFVPVLQEAIGRVQPVEMIAEAAGILRRAGIKSLNFDLMYGLPGQLPDDVLSSLDLAAELGADRVALFGYAHLPHLIPRQRQIDATNLPNQDLRFEMAARGYMHMVDAGYVPVGFDHFAAPDDPLAVAALSGELHRNFQGFTDDPANTLIGLGASAISSFPILSSQNTKDAGDYRRTLLQGKVPAALGKKRTVDDRRRGAIIAELLCRGRARVDSSIMESAQNRLKPYRMYGLFEYSNDWLVIPDEALPYARSIAACFDRYRGDSARRFSSAV